MYSGTNIIQYFGKEFATAFAYLHPVCFCNLWLKNTVALEFKQTQYWDLPSEQTWSQASLWTLASDHIITVYDTTTPSKSSVKLGFANPFL